LAHCFCFSLICNLFFIITETKPQAKHNQKSCLNKVFVFLQTNFTCIGENNPAVEYQKKIKEIYWRGLRDLNLNRNMDVEDRQTKKQGLDQFLQALE
jgi:hypothetical protein